MANGIKITYSRIKRLDCGHTMKTNEQQTTSSRVKDTGVPEVQAPGGEANGTSGKWKEISPLQAEDQKKRKIKRRMKPNHLKPIDSEMEIVSQEPVQEKILNGRDEEDKKRKEKQRKEWSEEDIGIFL